MISRLYVNNYKCLVNFEVLLSSTQLIFGRNGAGKSAILSAVERIRQYAAMGVSVEELFSFDTKTSWNSVNTQVFEVDLTDATGNYEYSLVIEQNPEEGKARAVKESLKLNGSPVFLFAGNIARLLGQGGEAGPSFPFDGSRSAIASVPQTSDTRPISQFRLLLSNIYCFSINPWAMYSSSSNAVVSPAPDCHDFPSFFRHLTQATPEIIGPIFKSLEQVIEGFVSLQLINYGDPTSGSDQRFMYAKMRRQSENGGLGEYRIPFDLLSEGQKCLVVLYTLRHCMNKATMTFFLDEPDNFLSLREIQPLLLDFIDAVENTSNQVLIISHHPEILNQLAVSSGVYVTRSEGGPTRLKQLSWESDPGLTAAEIVARGWEE